MAQSIRFLRSCPSCGKPLQISIDLLGKDVLCHVCGSQFRAVAVDQKESSKVDEIDLKVARLIQEADKQLARHHGEAIFQD